MKSEKFKVTIHMVMSLDGFIASEDGDISWLTSKDNYENGITLSPEYIDVFLKGIDCYVMGSNTYEQALNLGWPYGDTPVFVLTNKDLKTNNKNVQFYSGDLNEFVRDHLKPIYQNVWIAGGAKLAKEFIRKKLADEIIVSIMPVILGKGKLFFDNIGKEQLLHLKDVQAYKDGMVELSYEIKK